MFHLFPSAGYYCQFANINTLNVIALVHDYLSVFVHNKTVHIHHLPDHDSLDRHLLLGSLCLIVYFIYMIFFPFRINRECKHSTTIDGITIPEGIVINISIIGAHRDPEIYPNPDEFDPER